MERLQHPAGRSGQVSGGKRSATTGFSGTKRVDPGGIAESLLAG